MALPSHPVPAQFSREQREAFECARQKLKQAFPMFAIVAVKNPETSAAVSILCGNQTDVEDMAAALILAGKSGAANDQN